ncbi:LysR family transcriptional regulator [Streptomyces sp. NPDC057543]|uniref:helix-turn-helix domain-containing protein n=1 Tax=Streptomyces sp. NPDC057543 TaxID=3346163 RepID=UPI0036A2A62A
MIRPTLGSSYAIRRLRLFTQVVRYPTLIEACQTHGIHPSTLTMQLKRLETDLGGPLLIRASRGRHSNSPVSATTSSRPSRAGPTHWRNNRGRHGPDRSGALHGQGAGARADTL